MHSSLKAVVKSVLFSKPSSPQGQASDSCEHLQKCEMRLCWDKTWRFHLWIPGNTREKGNIRLYQQVLSEWEERPFLWNIQHLFHTSPTDPAVHNCLFCRECFSKRFYLSFYFIFLSLLRWFLILNHSQHTNRIRANACICAAVALFCRVTFMIMIHFPLELKAKISLRLFARM